MRLLNLGGPGWFNDVVGATVELSSSRSVRVPDYWGADSCKVFESTQHVRGQLKLTPPAGHRVWHTGISVSLVGMVTFFDSFRSLEHTLATAKLADPGYIEAGGTSVDLDIDLGQVEGIYATYTGSTFRMRHHLVVTVSRPWYTFDIVVQTPLSIYTVDPAPLADPEGAPGHTMEIADCHGRCTFDFRRSCYNMHDAVQGTVRFYGVQTPIVRVELLLVLLESGDGSSADAVKDERVLFQAGTSMIATGDVPEQALTADQAFQPAPAFQGDGVLQVRYDLDKVFHPSVVALDVASDEAADEAGATEVVDVRYFLRLRLTNVDGQQFWNTSEVWIYCDDLREPPVPPSPTAGPASSGGLLPPPPEQQQQQHEAEEGVASDV